MTFKHFSNKLIIGIIVAGSIPLLSACSNKAANNDTAADASTEMQGQKNGNEGGRQSDSPGGSSAIDKSGDATLQSMIKELVPKFRRLEYKDEQSGITMKYNLYVPENLDKTKKYPMVLFIADASTPGTDITRPLTQGYGGLIWATSDWQKSHPCYVLVPQFTGVAVNDDYEHTDEVDVAMRLVKKVADDNNVDTNRLYSTGQSMGGMISMYYDIAYPDVFAASLFVDCHWDTNTFSELVKHKFVYFIAGNKGKAYSNLKPLEEAAEKARVQYTYAEWSAKLPEARQSDLAAVMLEKGAPINIFEFETGSVLPADGKGSEHMYSFDYAYKVKSVREWLFNQHK